MSERPRTIGFPECVTTARPARIDRNLVASL
jgi:hypothetical protein